LSKYKYNGGLLVDFYVKVEKKEGEREGKWIVSLHLMHKNKKTLLEKKYSFNSKL
jgi:hypothetical protein